MNRIILQTFLSLLYCSLSAQPSFTLQQAEAQLQSNNLQLLAHQYEINAAEAAVIQARIWEQPYFTAELNAANPENKRAFDIGANGQKAFAIQQLIYLGGKKRNELAYAKNNVALAKLEFEQLLRNLKYRLSQTFYSIYFDNQKIRSIELQMAILDDLVANYNIQAQKGNIPLREVVRLQSLLLNLKNEKVALHKDIMEARQQFALLTGVPEPITPLVNEGALLEKIEHLELSKDSVLAAAVESNIEYLSMLKAEEGQRWFVKWQKSLAVPDLNAGLAYDQRGGAFQNQVNLTVGIPLPFWNRNKGNIRMAEAGLQQLQVDRDFKKLELQGRAATAWELWHQQALQYMGIDKSAPANFDIVYEGVLNNFQKRNITLLEFTDFMESYNQSMVQINEMKKAVVLSGVDLNYLTNKNLF